MISPRVSFRAYSRLAVLLTLGTTALLTPTTAWAVTRYVDGTAATCSNYAPATRLCSGGSANNYSTIPAGIRALEASDVLLIRQGTYALSGTYGNSPSDTYGCKPNCPTSWATATRISNYPGEVVVMNGGSFNMDSDNYPNGLSYLIWQGDARANFISQNGFGTGMRVNNAVHHIRISTMTIRDWTEFGIQGGTSTGCTQRMNAIQVLNTELRHNGEDGVAGNGNYTHGIYPTCGDNWLIDGNYAVDNWGYGIHANGYGSSAAFTGMVISNNRIEGRSGPCCTVSGQTAGGIVVTAGNDTLVFNNVVIGKGSAKNYLQVGIQISYYNVTGVRVFNNTLHDMAIGVQTQDATGTVISNNLFSNVANNIDVINVSGATGTHNLCSFNDQTISGACDVVNANPGFMNAAALDFRLSEGSPAINAGVTLAPVTTDLLGVSRPQGAAYDIGAYEFVSNNPDLIAPSAPTGLQVD